MKPLIGITSGKIYNKEFPHSPYTYGQTYTYINAIEQAGGIPIILPIITDQIVAHQLMNTLDGIVIAGGNDVSPALYDQPNTLSKDVDETRDAWELSLIRHAELTNKPLYAICRGMQLLNVFRGGTLFQDIANERPGSLDHTGTDDDKNLDKLAHTISLHENSLLRSLTGESEIQTNTYHHQAINSVGTKLIVTAVAPDGVIEGIEDPSKKFLIGVQGHPESIFHVEHGWQKIFAYFIEQAASYKTNR